MAKGTLLKLVATTVVINTEVGIVANMGKFNNKFPYFMWVVKQPE